MTDPETTDLSKAMGTPLTTARNYEPAVKARAYQLFLNTDLTLSDIAMEIQVSETVLASWSKNGKWMEKKRDIEDQLLQRAEGEFRKKVALAKVEVLERHLKTSGLLEQGILDLLEQAKKSDEPLNDRELKRLSEALASVTGVSSRAVGIGSGSDSRGRNNDSSSLGSGNPAKIPVIMIGVQARLPSKTELEINMEGQTIDV